MHVLDQEAPGLAGELERLLPEARRKVLASACLQAAAACGDLDDETAGWVETIRRHGELSSKQAAAALASSVKADDRYFALRDDGAPSAEYLTPFSQARLLRGMAVAFGAVQSEGAADAIYELTKTCDDASDIIRSIRQTIHSLSGR